MGLGLGLGLGLATSVVAGCRCVINEGMVLDQRLMALWIDGWK